MNHAFQRLLADSEPIGCSHTYERQINYYTLPSTLRQFYRSHNGVYIFNRALLVRPFQSIVGVYGLMEWNDPALWKHSYRTDLTDYVFFAEDVVGFSFCFGLDKRVYLFDPEIGELYEWADSLESWASKILEDPNEVGSGLAESWVNEDGEIPFGFRIPPVIPFVFAESEGMGNILISELMLASYRCELATQIQSVSDGAQISIQSITDYMRAQL